MTINKGFLDYLYVINQYNNYYIGFYRVFLTIYK